MIINGIDIFDDTTGLSWNPGRRIRPASLTFLRNLAIATQRGETRIEVRKMERMANVDPTLVYDWEWCLSELANRYKARNAKGHWKDYVAITRIGERLLKARGEWPEILEAAEAKPVRRRA